MKYNCKLSDLCMIITPQVGVEMNVYDASSGKLLWNGPAHYLTTGADISKRHIKSIAIKDGNYKVEVARS